jgi:hypothetical protein
MIGLVVLFALFTLALVAVIALCVNQLFKRWEQRVEETRIEREIRRAEKRLHDMASNAFGAMLNTARQQRDDGWSSRK